MADSDDDNSSVSHDTPTGLHILQTLAPSSILPSTLASSPHDSQLNGDVKKKLQQFWDKQLKEVEDNSDFKTHQLPLARIKKIMKSDEDVRMISAEAPVLFAKACELFILELTLRAWMNTDEGKRRTLQRADIASAVTRTESFDFLIDIVPRDDQKPKRATRPQQESDAPSSEYYPPVYQYTQPGPGVLWTQPPGTNAPFANPPQSGNLLPPLPAHLQTPPSSAPTATPSNDALPSVLFYPVGSNQQAMAVPLSGTASGAMTSLPPLPALPAQTFRFAQNGNAPRPVFQFGQQFTMENPVTNDNEEENQHLEESSDEESSDEENV